MHVNWQGETVIDQETPAELQNLRWSDLPYVCPIMTHVNLKRSGGHVLSFPHVNGSISMYRSERYISREDGMFSLAVDRTIPEASVERIVLARQWLADNNHLFNFVHQVVEPDAVGMVEEDPSIVADVFEGDANRQLFPTAMLEQQDPGPRAADHQLEQLNIGLDTRSDDLVLYSNPDVVALLFPELFPYGHGAFALWHHKAELRTPEQEGLPIMTIKDFAKYRLNHFSRNFAEHNRFICFSSNWISKNAAFGYRLRTTTATRQGQATTGGNVLQGGRFHTNETMALPQTIRTSAAYKVRLRQDLEAMFRHFGTPELFGTWTVNLSGPGFTATLPNQGAAIVDVPKFCATYQREWHRVWSFIRESWAPKVVGGLRAYTFVVEYQERGAPHVHYVLWTCKSFADLIAQNNSGEAGQVIVSCSARPEREDVAILVDRHQVHRHSEQYCMRTNREGEQYCRFGFPKPHRPSTAFNEATGEVFYERHEGDELVNGYNPELLLFTRANMDIQLNTGERALQYIAKYISKSPPTLQGSVAGVDQGGAEAQALGTVQTRPGNRKYFFPVLSLTMPSSFRCEVVFCICD